jgi:hypothetical protein
MRTSRQHRIDRAVARVLSQIGDYLLPQESLIDEVSLLIMAPRPTRAEIEDSIRHHEANGRITGVHGETGPKWKLSDTGRAWWAENQ